MAAHTGEGSDTGKSPQSIFISVQCRYRFDSFLPTRVKVKTLVNQPSPYSFLYSIYMDLTLCCPHG